jgi:hypothetical protein
VAAADTARLIASLELQNKLGPGISSALKDVGKLETRLGRIGQHAQRGVQNAAANLTRLGVVAGGLLATQVYAGVKSLEELERVTNATEGVIKSTGSAAGVTAKEIRDMAQALEDVTTADDKVIQGGQNLLLTFTNIGEDVFPKATKSMVDLGIAMAQGDVANADFKASAIQIGKALNDPIKGITALTRVGVSFTEQQKAQIKAMVEAGDVAGAQTIILQELEREFGNAGKAAGQGFGADMRRFQDAVEGAQQALARGLLPLISRVSKELQTRLSDPAVLRGIEEFGEGLADGFDQALVVARQIPWTTIGDAMKLAGQGAKAALGFFTSLPPWVQTAVITGWGLNKLTGGALGGIIGELGKGLVKGVLGMNAGVVNARAGVVNVAGGIGGAGAAGAAGAGGKAAGALGVVSKVFIAGAAAVAFAAVVSELKGIRDDQAAANAKAVGDFGTQTVKFAGEQDLAALLKAQAGMAADMERLTTGLTPEAIAYQLNIDGVRDAVEASARTLQIAIEKANTKALTSVTPGEIKTHTGLDEIDANTKSQLRALFENTGVTRTTGDYVADQIKRNKEATDKAKAAVDQVKFATDATKAAINTVRTAVGGATSAVKLGADRSVNETARVKAAVERAKAAVATVTSAVGTAKAAIDTVRTAVGGTTTAIKRKDLSFNLTQNNNIWSRLFVNGYQMQVELDRSTTVVRGTSGGQTPS